MNHLFFVKSLILLFLSLGSLCIYNQESKPREPIGPLFNNWKETTKTTKNKHLLEHRVEPVDTVRIAIIGLGNRGQMALERLPKIVGVQIKAISDIDSSKVNQSAERYFLNDNLKVPDLYYGSSDWKSISERDDIDLIYICTHWELHTPIAVYAMEHDKHVAVEVPAALTVEECWRLAVSYTHLTLPTIE